MKNNFSKRKAPAVKLRFDRDYFLVFMSLFLTEVIIALQIRDSFVRPYVGDFLVVIFIYTFILSFLHTSKVAVAILVFTLALIIECSQFLHLITFFNLDNSWVKIVLGNSFDWNDVIAYFLGIIVISIAENLTKKR